MNRRDLFKNGLLGIFSIFLPKKKVPLAGLSLTVPFTSCTGSNDQWMVSYWTDPEEDIYTSNDGEIIEVYA